MGIENRSVVACFDEATKILRARGSERVTWLNGLLTCDVGKLAPGSLMPGLLVEKKGKITAEVFVAAAEDELWVLVTAGRCDKVHEVFEHHLIMEDVELSVASPPIAMVHGVTREGLRRVPGRTFGLDRGHGDECVIIADGPSEGDAVRRALVDAGVSVDDVAFEARRIEAGAPRFGVDYTTEHYPQEAALARAAVSFSKGCYLGQEVVYMLENRGHAKRRLVHLEGAGVLGLGPVRSEAGETVGDVTSAAGPFGIAMVKAAFAKADTALLVGDVRAKVTERLP